MKTNIKKQLEKQGHRFIGDHGSVKICRWTRKSLVDEGVCYKEKFYGIKSHLCCQMSPWLGCENKCLHCWRPIEIDFNKVKSREIKKPSDIINESINFQRKLLTGFKGNKKVNKEKYKEAQEPMQFAISLIGEPTLYPKIGEFILELRKKRKTIFLVSNGLNPEVLKKLDKEDSLPTQLYISLNAPNKEFFDKWHKSNVKDAWKKYNKSLDILKDLKSKTRTVLRMTLVKDKNMKDIQVDGYVKLIKKTNPDFVEVKGFVSVGFSRQRLGYDMMPTHEEIKEFADKLVKELKKVGLKDYKILDEHEVSKIVLIGEGMKEMKIKD
ncbi:MAG: 4-demethylwyosine synthase TYW1 [archaeon]